MIITHEFAQRLEHAEALDAVDCAEASCKLDASLGTTTVGMGGGVLVFCGEVSPLTHALGIGMAGPVTEQTILEIEGFFRSRNAPVVVDVAAHADPSVREILSSRGYRIADFTNVLVRRIAPAEQFPDPPAGITLRRAEPNEGPCYSETIGCGFFSRSYITQDELTVGLLLFHMKGGRSYFALADGRLAGGCGLSLRNGIASLYGDATLMEYRGRGIHTAMIRRRLQEAMEAGCEYATAGTQPGSTSQRNYQRLGFEVAYSKLTMVKD